MDFRKIEDSKAYVEQLLAEGAETFTAVKKDNARIVAREGIVGETIDTYTKDGNGEWAETSHVVTADEQGRPEWVVTMADKDGKPIEVDDAGHYNTYTNTAEYFEQNAVPAEKEGVYRQKQVERTFLTISEDISITPSWGGSMQLPAGSHLNISNLDDIYGVAASEFDQTYDRTGEQTEKKSPEKKAKKSKDDYER